MTHRLVLSAVLALGLCAPAGAQESPAEPTSEAGAASTRSPMPFDIIRSLQFLQDQVARGNDRAIRVQALLLKRFAPVFLAADAPVWSDPRNQRAAVLFVLSGGPAEVLEGLIAADVLPIEDRGLYDGAIAYVRNDVARARDTLSLVDLSDMEPGLAGHINLVLGQLWQEDEPERAAGYLDRARLLAPGGLIEEAALRLEVLIVDGLGRHDQADRLARQYFDRYSASSYSANFEARFAAIFSARGMGEADKAMAAMTDVIAGLPAERRRTLLLAVARRALVEGRMAFAHQAAGAALEIGGMTPADEARARLYHAAAAVGPGDSAGARRALADIPRDLLHPQDAALLDAAGNIVAEIERAPSLLTQISEEPVDGMASPVLDRAERVLGRLNSEFGTQTQ
ncbi:hypothetical protein [Aureimonas populi]|uniref:Chemotaxis protein MotC n=1 Tax=Aureimonas populi TaxID=1701758 RepID=A0ABW5CGR6_9HYPH|nr:hypothetical protein [Aureimonas populi]